MTELNNNIIGILEPMTPYMLRNDGVLLSCGTVHPYIKMSNSDTYENNLKTLERHPEFLTWFLSNSTNDETKALLNDFETNKSEDLLNKLNDLTNQEFCRVRTSNYKQKYGGDNGQIYFRISSVGFNWFELIWKVVARFSSIIKEVTIVKDNQTFGGREFNYYCNHMPINEFLTMKGNPIMENKNALLENLTAAQKQKLSDVWDYLEQNDFIDVDNCTDDALALRNIDENLVEELQAMLSKAPATLKHLASFLEAHTFETLMNLGLFEGAGIKSITIPDSVKNIGNGVFAYCGSLTSVDIPDSVTSIGDEAFSYCHSLESIILEKGISKTMEDQLRKEYGAKVKLQENLTEDLTQLEEAPEKHDTLNPKLWDIEKNELKPEVSDKVLEIAKDFTDGLDEDEVKYKLLDVKLVGSNCSYNYNKASDLDVHLVFDLSIYDDDEKEKMAELLYNYARSLWNKNHTVEFYGIPVEIYVETENSEEEVAGEEA